MPDLTPSQEARGIAGRLADALAVSFICKNAAWSIVTGRFGTASEALLVVAWYASAVLYGALAVTPQAEQRPAALRYTRLTAAVACGGTALSQAAFERAGGPVAGYDWLALACAFACSALSAGTSACCKARDG